MNTPPPPPPPPPPQPITSASLSTTTPTIELDDHDHDNNNTNTITSAPPPAPPRPLPESPAELLARLRLLEAETHRIRAQINNEARQKKLVALEPIQKEQARLEALRQERNIEFDTKSIPPLTWEQVLQKYGHVPLIMRSYGLYDICFKARIERDLKRGLLDEVVIIGTRPTKDFQEFKEFFERYKAHDFDKNDYHTETVSSFQPDQIRVYVNHVLVHPSPPPPPHPPPAPPTTTQQQ